MIGIVLDTNAIVSGLLWSGAPGEILEGAVDGQWVVYTTSEIIDELERVLRRPKFATRYERTGETADDCLATFRQLARLVEASDDASAVCRDPGDVIYLRCALGARADYLVTGDSDLLVLGSIGDTAIVSPRDFLDRVNTPTKSNT